MTARQYGAVIPFYFDVAELKTWYPQFAIKYYTVFASQYSSFLERDETLVRTPLTLEQIREYGLENSIQDVRERFIFQLISRMDNGSRFVQKGF